VSGPARIRNATRHDAADIAHVHVESRRTTYAGILPDLVLLQLSERRSAQSWRRYLAMPGVFLVAEVGDSVVGFVNAGANRVSGTPYSGEIYALYLLSEHQGMGIGRALLGASFQRLARSGHDSAMLWVLSRNPTRFFYEAMGGRKFAERAEMVGGEPQQEFAYGWDDLDVFG